MRRAALILAVLAASCGGAGTASGPQIGTIRQAPATRRIVIYGDSRPAVTGESFFLGREDPVKERRLVIERIAREKPDLIVHSGDLVARGSSEGAWKLWDETHRPILDAKIPFFPALGNHEYTGENKEALGYFNQRFPALGGCKWYSVQSGPLLIVILDSNFDDLGHRAVKQEDAWYRKTLQEAEADRDVKGVIVVCHHPPYTNSSIHGESEEVRRRFADPAASFPKFRLFVAGHVHNYERFLIEGRPFVVSGGGGAPRTPVLTSKFRTEPIFQGPEFRPFHYLLVTVGEAKATVEVMMLQPDESWRSGDRFEFGL